MKESILIIEDEPAIQSALALRLRSQGYVVVTADDGREGFKKATTTPCDLIILDVLLPDQLGFDVCRDIRRAGLATPILILSARRKTSDKVTGLKLGADDYLAKPFASEELIARIEVLLRRKPHHAARGVYVLGTIRVDLVRAEVMRDGRPVRLSAREYQLLQYLIENERATVTRSELLRTVWGRDENSSSRTVDVHISSLRDKLEQNPRCPQLIVTVSGVGYKLTGTKPSEPARSLVVS